MNSNLTQKFQKKKQRNKNQMNIHFYKYQGTGNDFVIVDNRDSRYSSLATAEIEFLCNRKFGIGADGFMLLENQKGFDFKMIYYNSDGKESSMCGNGGRCIVAFAQKLGIIKDATHFIAIDGNHDPKVYDNEIVSLKMKDVIEIEENSTHFYLNTGSPHYVSFVSSLNDFQLVNEAKKIRYNERFKEKGTNVNFVEINDKDLLVRTYERGVEDETLSCGTGVTAVALCAALKAINGNPDNYDIKTQGGNVNVSFNRNGKTFTDIWLTGSAKFVFEGDIYV